jgi:hypothetical protein
METPGTAPIPSDEAKQARKRERQKAAWLKWRQSDKGQAYFAKRKQPQP